jgi:hypothetical protein
MQGSVSRTVSPPRWFRVSSERNAITQDDNWVLLEVRAHQKQSFSSLPANFHLPQPRVPSPGTSRVRFRFHLSTLTCNLLVIHSNPRYLPSISYIAYFLFPSFHRSRWGKVSISISFSRSTRAPRVYDNLLLIPSNPFANWTTCQGYNRLCQIFPASQSITVNLPAFFLISSRPALKE